MLELKDFEAAADRLKNVIHNIPLSTSCTFSATQGYGAEVVLAGNIYDEAYAKACEICEETGAEFIHPFDDEDVMAGQGHHRAGNPARPAGR